MAYIMEADSVLLRHSSPSTAPGLCVVYGSMPDCLGPILVSNNTLYIIQLSRQREIYQAVVSYPAVPDGACNLWLM